MSGQIALGSARMRVSSMSLLFAFAGVAAAETFTVEAGNAGQIDGSGRVLEFDLSGVVGEIRRARLELDLDYSIARELTLTLDSNGQQLPLAQFATIGGTTSWRGTYRFEDEAITTWVQLEAAAGGRVVDAKVAARAFQTVVGETCFNLLTRFLEFDIDRSAPLHLVVDRFAAIPPGGGSIDAARLVVDTGIPDRIAASGFDEPGTPIERCQRPSNDLFLNGMIDRTRLSPITLIELGGVDLQWYVRQRVPLQDVGPLAFGGSQQQIYVGRFGGRTRMNLGVFDPASGTLTFTTGAGARTIQIAGDWLAQPYRLLPGDYDGDGVTDLALAYLDGDSNRWFARIRYSDTEVTRDYPIDPRIFDPALFTSAAIGWGAGQDTDRDGRDEIVGYAEIAPGLGMSYLQLIPSPSSGAITLLRTGTFGQRGDQLVLGKWQPDAYNAMRVFRVAGFLRWQQFGAATSFGWGDPGDVPLSIDVDADVVNDIAVFRPTTGEIYAVQSTNGEQITLPALTAPSGTIVPLGFVQGVTAPLEQ
jgi:hypothetical protein